MKKNTASTTASLPAVQQGDNIATLHEDGWKSASESFALWLNQVATTVDEAIAYGCTLPQDTPAVAVPDAPASDA